MAKTGLRIAALTGLGLFVSGCSTHNPVPLSGAAPVENSKEISTPVEKIREDIGEANVVFIRRYAQPTAFGISIKVDDKKIGSLGQREFTAVTLPAGTHKVVAKWPFIASQEPIEFDLVVSGEQTHFVEMTGEVNASFGGIYTSYTNYVGARELKSDEGIDYISKCCRYKAPKT